MSDDHRAGVARRMRRASTSVAGDPGGADTDPVEANASTPLDDGCAEGLGTLQEGVPQLDDAGGRRAVDERSIAARATSTAARSGRGDPTSGIAPAASRFTAPRRP